LNNSKNYLNYLKIIILDEYKFGIEIDKEIKSEELYIIMFSYIKNENLVINKINLLKKRVIGTEYINLIGILNFSLYDFIIFRQQNLNRTSDYTDSNFDFVNSTDLETSITIEIQTFNKHGITPFTKPKLNDSSIV